MKINNPIGTIYCGLGVSRIVPETLSTLTFVPVKDFPVIRSVYLFAGRVNS